MFETLDTYLLRQWPQMFAANSTLMYLTYDWWQVGIDSRSDSFYLVKISSPTMGVSMLIYLLLVWWLIPRLMKNRAPLNINRLVTLYDFLLVLINGYFFYQSIRLTNYGRAMFTFSDTRGDTSATATEYIRIANQYYISKWIDMFDTFFMAFRKRNSQITFLHLWHHVSLTSAAYFYMKYNPYTPSILIIPIVNSFVHMLMYSYYGLASFGPHMQRYLWWKKYITQIQLIQFTIVFAWYIFLAAVHKDLPQGYLACNIGNSAFLFLLFGNFYIQSYRKKSNSQISNGKVEKIKIKDN